MKTSFLITVSSVLSLLMFQPCAFSQNDRSFIRDAIYEYGECRNVAITKYNGDLMLYGDNGWAASGCPEGLTDALSELNDDGEYINDVQLTEAGSWIILYGDNGFRWYDIPYSLEQEIREYNDDGEEITSVTFNDAGDWILISKAYYSASDSRVLEWMKEGSEDYGQIWAACITDDAMVVVYERGYKFLGNVPDSLKEALGDTSLDIYRVKIAGTSWFIADKYGRYDYIM